MAKWEEKRYTGKVRLSCQCERSFLKPWPKIGETLWCVKHSKEVTVISNSESKGNFGWRCQCGTSRSYGADKQRSEQVATRHNAKHPDRLMYLTNGGTVYEKWRPEEKPRFPILGGLPIDPPF